MAHVAHVGGAAGGLPRRTEETVLRLLAELAAAPKDEALSRLLNFKLDAKAAVRKTTVSAVLRNNAPRRKTNPCWMRR